MPELNFFQVADEPAPDNCDYDDGGCQCPPGDNNYLLELDEGQTSLTHAACGKQPSSSWGDWQDLVFMNPIPVTVEWERECDGSPWHGLTACDDGSFIRVEAAGPSIDPKHLHSGRQQLVEAMSGVSEERWCAGWLEGLDRRLHEEGGIWEILGRAVGWPTGSYKQRVWVSWDEAAALYAEETQPADRPPE
ncbi:hypothetical protein [Streptomyces scabiei]|uniref:hypothetical protein n=1 Tax=Streptomyces scabiei TaxID=1930 RepID=UPI0038F68CD1